MSSKNIAFEITQIVPRLKPATDGVGEYALILAKELLETYGIKTKFIVADPHWNGSDRIEDFEIKVLKERTVSALLEALENSSYVLLQYVGYSYAKKGCPLWLSKALQAFSQSSSEKHLIVYFHELLASGKPWSSAFWLRPLQKFVARSLAQISKRCLVSNSLYAEMLTSFQEEKIRPDILPLCSLIGEGQQIKSFKNRDSRLVVFGTLGRRLEVYRNSSNYLEMFCRYLGIKEIIDIGQASADIPASLVTIPIKKMGIMQEAEICQIMSTALVGVVDYPAMLLGKSSIFAAYCSFALLPVVLGDLQSLKYDDGISAGTQYISVGQEIESFPNDKLEQISLAAHNWYLLHDRKIHAKHFAEIFNEAFGQDRLKKAEK